MSCWECQKLSHSALLLPYDAKTRKGFHPGGRNEKTVQNSRKEAKTIEMPFPSLRTLWHRSDLEEFLKVIVRSLPPPFMRQIPPELLYADRFKTQEKFKSSGSLHQMEKLEKVIKLKKLAKLVNVKFWQSLNFQLTHLTQISPCRSPLGKANATMLTMWTTVTCCSLG
jgi:hypothetical protein